MAGFNSTITVQGDLRPCIANGKKALFHMWVDHGEVVYAVVEYENGQSDKVSYWAVRFLDTGNRVQENACFFYEEEDMKDGITEQ